MKDLRSEFSCYLPSSETENMTHVIANGKGSFYRDIEGREYLDFSSGIFTNSFGHGDDELAQSLYDSFVELANIHGRHWVKENDIYRRLFSYLPEGNYRVIPYAGEGGYLIDRIEVELYYHFSKRKYNLAAFSSGFHGKTQGTKLTVNRTQDSTYFYSHLIHEPDCLNCPCGITKDKCSLECAELAERELIENMTDVFIFEPVIGSRIIIPPEGYLKRVCDFCREHGILTVADEIITCGGRTGNFFASTLFGISPDVIAAAKGLANGMPMSMMFMKKELTENEYSVRKGNYSSTFMNIPALLSLTGKVLEKLERENIFSNVTERGRELLSGLEAMKERYPVIRDVRGIGLMAAMEFTHDLGVFRAAERNGLELIDSGPVVRIAPPLNVTSEEIYLGLERLERSIKEVLR